MSDDHSIDSEEKDHEGVRKDNAAGNAKFEAELTVGERQTYAAQWQRGSNIERTYQREFRPVKDPDSFRTDDMLGSYDFYGSELKTNVLRELLEFDPDEFSKEKVGERDLLAEAVRKAHADGLAGEESGGDGNYDPFRSEIISKVLEEQLGPESKGCNICDLDDYQAMRIDWGYVGALIQKEAAVRRWEFRREQKEAERELKRKEREEAIQKRIMNDPNLSANAKYMRFEPPMDFMQAMWYGFAGAQPELKGVVGVGGGSFAAQNVAGGTGVYESASVQFVMDSNLNAGVALCGGSGVALGKGYLAGIQVSGLWGIDSICELEGMGISHSLGAGWAERYGISGDIGRNGLNILFGFGKGGWGGTLNILGGCKILWSLHDCESEVVK